MQAGGLSHHAGKLWDSVFISQRCYAETYAKQVPGGVGPMTIAMLLRNTINGCQRTAQTAAAREDATQAAEPAGK